MQTDLTEEKKATTKRWSKRGTQLRTLLDSTAGIQGDLEGIVGREPVEIQALRDTLPIESEVGEVCRKQSAANVLLALENREFHPEQKSKIRSLSLSPTQTPYPTAPNFSRITAFLFAQSALTWPHPCQPVPERQDIPCARSRESALESHPTHAGLPEKVDCIRRERLSSHSPRNAAQEC